LLSGSLVHTEDFVRGQAIGGNLTRSRSDQCDLLSVVVGCLFHTSQHATARPISRYGLVGDGLRAARRARERGDHLPHADYVQGVGEA
jgi:hypothetical protein